MGAPRHCHRHFPSIPVNLPYVAASVLNRWAPASVLCVDGLHPAGRGAGPAPGAGAPTGRV